MNKKIKERRKLIEELDKVVKHNRNATILKRDDCKMIIDYVKDLQEQAYEYEQLIDIQDKREYHKRYLEERRKEEPNLLYPDYDEIYKRYYEQKEKIDKAIEYLKNIGDEPDANMYLQFKEYKEYNVLLSILEGKKVTNWNFYVEY